MNRQQRRKVAKQIAALEKSSNENNMPEVMSEIGKLVLDATVEDLFAIDEEIMKKYLTD